MQLHIKNMTCGGCSRTVTKVIQNIDPDAVIVADLPSRTVEIETLVSEEDIITALCSAGFPPQE